VVGPDEVEDPCMYETTGDPYAISLQESVEGLTPKHELITLIIN
jgi:hypothetical protein